jgi:hypothetical protein
MASIGPEIQPGFHFVLRTTSFVIAVLITKYYGIAIRTAVARLRGEGEEMIQR